MIAYESASNREKQADALRSIFTKANDFLKATTPTASTASATTSILSSMGASSSGLTAAPKQASTTASSFAIPVSSSPVATGDVVSKLDQHFGQPVDQKHTTVRNSFASRFAGLDDLLHKNPSDVALTSLRDRMQKTYEEFEVKFKEAMVNGKRDIAEPAAQALRQVYQDIEKTAASKTTVAPPSQKNDSPVFKK